MRANVAGKLAFPAWRAVAVLVAVGATPADAADRYWPPIVDPPTGQHTPGRWVWADLVTSDVSVAAVFYGHLFGWTYETYGGDDDLETYTLVLSDGLPIGGMVFDRRAVRDSTPTARWVGLVSVPDVPTAAAVVTRLGGKVVVAPTVLGERGETAVFQDPDGAVFGAVYSSNGDPDDFSGDLNEWLWVDLWTDDVSRAADFYRAVAGYEIEPLPAGHPGQGVRLASGGFLRAGIMRKNDDRETSVWLPYVRVADVAATAQKARAAGGRVVREPVRLERATVAVIIDPTGAPVGIAQLPDRGAQP